MTKPICVTVMSLVFLFANYTLGLACSCAYIGPLEMYKSADGVFTGVVTTKTAVDQYGIPFFRVGFRVTGVWKGINTSTVHVSTSSSGASCGVNLLPTEEYLVYAFDYGESPSGPWRTHLCTRTRRLEYAQEDLEAIGDPSPEPLSNSTWGRVKALYEN